MKNNFQNDAINAQEQMNAQDEPMLLMSLALNPFERGSTTWAYTSLAVTLGLVFLVAELTERKKNLWKGWLERLLWTTKS